MSKLYFTTITVLNWHNESPICYLKIQHPWSCNYNYNQFISVMRGKRVPCPRFRSPSMSNAHKVSRVVSVFKKTSRLRRRQATTGNRSAFAGYLSKTCRGIHEDFHTGRKCNSERSYRVKERRGLEMSSSRDTTRYFKKSTRLMIRISETRMQTK